MLFNHAFISILILLEKSTLRQFLDYYMVARISVISSKILRKAENFQRENITILYNFCKPKYGCTIISHIVVKIIDYGIIQNDK